MLLPTIAIEKRVVTYFTVILLIAAGISSFFSLGQLEDPEFTVKTAVVVTPYPGATPTEVELEITDRIELALQELKQIDYLESVSSDGLSVIKVNVKPEYWSDELPQIWDEVRRKVNDVKTQLPPGTGTSDIGDDYGDVFGLLLALTGDGFDYAELEHYADLVKKELSLVKGVARVNLWGVQQKVIYLDTSQTQLSQLGLTDANVEATLKAQNMVVDAGSLDSGNKRLSINISGEFTSPEEIANLVIRPSTTDQLASQLSQRYQSTNPSSTSESELIHIRDIGTVRAAYQEPPSTQMRHNGEPALGIAITNIAGANVVDVGRAVDARLKALIVDLPIGIQIEKVHWQSDVIAESINGFFINLIEAVLIVLVVLTLAMGWRMGVVIGTALLLTILITFIFMAVFNINLQRMSLGALVIALGMMVDNAIVVADGFVVRVQRGMARIDAAIEAASQPAWPLLGATLIAVAAFYPIFASQESAGEYCRSLFTVVAISLLVSWLISVTITPLQCIDFLPPPADNNAAALYDSGLYQRFSRLLTRALRQRNLTITLMVGLLVISIVGFGEVKQLFFPDSSMRKFMIDYWAPQGTRIQQVSEETKQLEALLLSDKRITGVSTFIGAGPPRFYLPVDPEGANASYAQLIVSTKDSDDIESLTKQLRPWLAMQFPDSQVPVRKYGVGPSDTWKFQLRFSGPALAEPNQLRTLAQQGQTILLNSAVADTTSQTDWRQRVLKVVPAYNQPRARWADISRNDIAKSTKRAFDGRIIGLYREQDDLLPIIMRHQDSERSAIESFDILQIQPTLTSATIPLSQVVDAIVLEWQDPLIWRRDRRRTITLQGNPGEGVTFPTLRADVLANINHIKLPPGYQMEWGGEHESTVDAKAALIPGVIPATAIILFIIVALFNSVRSPLVILLTIPFAIIGIIAGLLLTGTAFGFLALLGAMSLVGMMVKNAIVLLDQIQLNIDAGMERYAAVIDAALSRLRPVLLAAATTVLGVIPLLQDVFWVGMAVSIMAGLTFGTLLTMGLVPVFYCSLYRISEQNTSSSLRPNAVQ